MSADGFRLRNDSPVRPGIDNNRGVSHLAGRMTYGPVTRGNTHLNMIGGRPYRLS